MKFIHLTDPHLLAPPGTLYDIDVAERLRLAVASINTHDLPTWDGYWHGRDIDDSVDLGLLDSAGADSARAARRRTCERAAARLVEYGFLADSERADLSAITSALLAYLAASDAEMMLVTLEDLWLAPLPHNVPGTTDERPNWRRRMSRSLTDILEDERIASMLQNVAARRRG